MAYNPKDLEDFLNQVAHDADNSGNISKADLKEYARSERLKNRVGRLKGIASIDDSGVFEGRRTDAINLESTFQEIQEYKKSLDEFGGDGVFKRLSDNAQRDLKKTGKNAIGDATKGIHEIEKIVKDSAKEESKLLEKIDKKAKQVAKDLKTKLDPSLSTEQRTKQLNEWAENLRTNKQEAIDAVREHFKDFRDDHVELKGKLESVISDIERETGLKSSELLASKSLTETVERAVEKSAEQAAGKGAGYFERISGNMSHGGGIGKAKVGLGLVAGVGLGYSGIKDVFAPGVDDQGQPVEGKKLTGLAKIVGAIIGFGVMSHNGGRAR